MQYTSVAQQQPGEKPTLATSPTQNTPKAQARAMIFKHPRNRHKHTNAARQRVRSEAQADVVRILDSPSPPPRTGLTTHATPRAEHHIHAPAEMAGRHPELSP